MTKRKKSTFQPPTTEFEIFPWIHNVVRKRHGEVVAHIKGLPRNSVIALEITPHKIRWSNRLIDILSGEIPLEKSMTRSEKARLENLIANSKSPGYAQSVLPHQWAVMEIIHECRKRNITIEPIASPVQEALLLPAVGKNDSEKSLQADLFAERIFVNNLYSLTAKYPRKKIPVFMGIFHAVPVKQQLKRKKVRCRINTRIFSNSAEMNTDINLYDRMRKAILKKNGVQEKALLNQITTNIRGRENRTDDPPKLVVELLQQLQDRRLKQQERLHRKLERKRKATANHTKNKKRK
jgi:hypothetical protein